MSKIYNETGQKFIFIMDEWDAVFHMSFITEEDKQNWQTTGQVQELMTPFSHILKEISQM